MWLLLIIAVALLWLIGRTRGNAAVPSRPMPMGGGLPPGLPDAVAQVESGGRQYGPDGSVITSSAGAIGEMQLMPGTAADLGVDPYDPAQNVQGGTAYLNQLYDQFGGDLNATLAAYNWGPGNVQRALQQGRPYPGSVQDYINAVLAAWDGSNNG